MITRLEIDGFKSLRDFAVDLEPFTVFIGPNSAGKSNILEAVGLLARLARMPIVEAFKGGRGRIIDQFTRHGSTNVQSMRFAVEYFEYEPRPRPADFQTRYRHELTIELHETKRGVQQLCVGDERFLAMARAADRWIEQHPEFEHCAGYGDAGTDFLATRPKSPNHITLRKANMGLRLLHLDAVHLDQPSERTDMGELASDASNLPTILATLPDSALGAIRAELAAMVPGIASFDILLGKDDFAIEFQLSGGELLPARLISDGTLRILALLTALHMEPQPSLLGIEEPENGVFSGRLRVLLERLRRASREPDEAAELNARPTEVSVGFSAATPNWRVPQILITTHSPVILSGLLSEPRHLRFIDMVRRNGERVTRARTVGPVSSPQEGRFVISPREIETILDTSHGEAAE